MKIGFASRDFTPPRPVLIHGQMHVRISKGVRDPLTVNAMAIDGGGEGRGAVLVSCDLVATNTDLVEAVRSRVRPLCPDLPADAIVLSATHTHESVVYKEGSYPPAPTGVMTTAECFELVAEAIAAAAVEAWNTRRERRLAPAFGHAVVGHNRRAVYTDGFALMYGATKRPDFSHIEGYEDHSVDMLLAWEPNGTLAGILLAVPCPSQVEEQLYELSADYWHETRVELRRRHGEHLAVIGLCSSAGDQSPHFLLNRDAEKMMRERRGTTERQEIALRLADAVDRVLACTPPPTVDPVIAHATARATLPGRYVNAGESAWAERELAGYEKAGRDLTLWFPRFLRGTMEHHNNGTRLSSADIQLHAVRVGDACFVTNPFELFIDYAMRMKAFSPAVQTVSVQLSCGSELYLPTARGAAGGHYSAHPAVAPIGPEGGDILVQESVALISKLFPAAAAPSK